VTVPPPVSVLLPVRDGEAHLADCIESLRAQTFPDFEVLAVDDGSTDRTPRMLRAWAEADERVRVIRQAPSGIVAALEEARAHARGSYLARMDADDISRPDRFRRQLDLMHSLPSVVAVGSRVRYFPPSAVRDGGRRYEAWLNAAVHPDEVSREIFVECPLAHPTFFLRAEAVAVAGGYRDEGWPEDYDLLLRLWHLGGGLAKVPEVLLDWRETPTRLSRNDARYSPAAFLRCKVHFLGRSLLSGGRPAVVWGSGPVGKAFARALAAEGLPLRAFVDVDPRKVGQTIHGAPVLPPDEALAVPDCLHLAAVGKEGVRREIRDTLRGAGKVEVKDFVAVA